MAVSPSSSSSQTMFPATQPIVSTTPSQTTSALQAVSTSSLSTMSQALSTAASPIVSQAMSPSPIVSTSMAPAVSPAKKKKYITESSGLASNGCPNLNSLPDLPVLQIASYLNTKDLLSFSHSCKNVNDICGGDMGIWGQAVKREKHEFCKEFVTLATAIKDRQTMFLTENSNKLGLLMYRKTLQNWTTGNSTRLSIPYESKLNTNIHINNHSSYLLVCSKNFENTSTEMTLNFTIWDVRNGKSTPFSVTVDKSQVSLDTVHLFNSVILMSFEESSEQGSIVRTNTCYKIDLEEEDLVKKWETVLHYAAGTFNHIWTSDRIFAFFILQPKVALGQKDKLLTEGFDMTDGSKLFSHKIDCPQYRKHSIAQSNKFWFVYALASRVIAINLKTNSVKVLKEDGFSIRKLVLKYDKLLCLNFNGDMDIINLATDATVWTKKVNFVSKIQKLDFDPFTDTVSAWLYRHEGHRWVNKAFSETSSVTVFRQRLNSSTFSIQCALMLGHFVRLEVNGYLLDQYQVKVSSQGRSGWKGVQFCADLQVPCINKISPFFLAVFCDGQINIHNFLSLDQYFQ